jgi:nucleotide-binding universal stress UspA family protein
VPVTLLKGILAATGAQLQVLHVDAEKEREEHLQQAAVLKELLKDVPAGYHTIQHPDFKEAVNLFASQCNADLIAAIPKKHSFLEGLFHHSHTKAIAFHSNIPLLLMHEES